jgi:uncharacterized lipoprotein YajG
MFMKSLLSMLACLILAGCANTSTVGGRPILVGRLDASGNVVIERLRLSDWRAPSSNGSLAELSPFNSNQQR